MQHDTLLQTDFERWAARQSARSALECRDHVLTYGALNAQADRFAQVLVDAGAGPDRAVAVMLDRSPELIVACLAALKAGGAYLPIDPAYPAHRVQQMLAGGKPVVAVTTPEHAPVIRSAGVPAITHANDDTTPQRAVLDAPARCGPHHLAYVIFTSGSTGRPKGVMIEHRAVVNTVRGLRTRYHIDRTSRVLLFSSPAFDSSLAEVFATLSSGATLVIPQPDTMSNLHRLAEFMTELRVTVATLPPAVLEHLALKPDSSLETIVSAGDVCPPELARRYVGTVRHFINAYGPTECAICVTTHEVTRSDENRVPIGKPLTNLRTFVLDDQGREVRENVIGMLYVSGVGLARGYIDPTPEDAARFTQHPTRPQVRLYRTGDRVYQTSDGNLHFVGRSDSLIKLRGVRMDTGDIESAVRALPGVSGCAVVLRSTRTRTQTLVCYYTAAAPIADHIIRTHVRSRLPLQYVPHHFVYLSVLPLTTQGKVDREALPGFGEEGLDDANENEAIAAEPDARDHEDQDRPLEALVRKTWVEVLDVAQVDDDRAFYEQGGDSLGAMRVAAEVSDVLSIDIQGTDVAEATSYQAFVAYIKAMQVNTEAKSPAAVSGEKADLPLTNIQEMFWFLDQLEPNAPMNNASKALELRQDVDVAVWRACAEETIVRHRVLHSRFRAMEAGPRQSIQDVGRVYMSYHDLSGEPGRGRRRQELLREHCWSPFDLVAGPLVRMTLLKVDAQRYLFVLTTHHIVCDGLSIDTLLSEVLARYAARQRGRAYDYDLQPPHDHHVDFIQWESSLPQNSVEADRAYWTSYLDGLTPSLELPFDRQPPGSRTYGGQTMVRQLEAEIKRGIERLSLSTGASVNEVLLSCFSLFLHRTCQQEDLMIGVPVSLRDRKEWLDAVGVFLNVLPIRQTLRGTSSLHEYLRQTHARFQQCLRHKHLGFKRIVEFMNPRRDPGMNPLFNVMFDFAVAPGLQHAGGVNPRIVPTPVALAKFDLSLSVVLYPNRMELTLEYSTERFRPATARRFLENFRRFVKAVAEGGDTPISQLPIMSEVEQARVLAYGQGMQVPLPSTSIVALFERQVLLAPTAPAVRFGRAIASYSDLAARAYAIGRRLRSLGVGRGAVVGLVMERSIDAVASIFAAWKLGAAYLPVQPDFPASRIAMMLRDAGASVVIIDDTAANSGADWDRMFAGRIVHSGDVPDGDSAHNAEALADCEGIVAQDVAYIIFTSGSTGRPKGVMIEHQGLLNHALAMVSQLALGPDCVVAQNAPFCFDISVWQLTTALLVGGQLVIYPREVVIEASDFVRLLDADRVTHLEVVPSFLAATLDALGEQLPNAHLEYLRWLLITGEAAPTKLVRRWLRRFPTIPVLNAYGPAEASDDVTTHTVRTRSSGGNAFLPVGKPLQNVTLYVLDQASALCPIGVPGEICVSGFVVGRGYVRAEDGRRAFGSDPFSHTAETRLYRTGDIGRWNVRGELEYLGRADHQVKINGQRIELEEIEAHLGQLVDDVAVQVSESPGGTRSLVAYYASRKEVSAESLRTALLDALPRYMVPAHFVPLQRLPRNANGKLDRRRLLELPRVQSRPSAEGGQLSPLVKEITAVWQRVLKLPAVRPDENFFDLGGDSLAAVRICGQLAQAGIKLAVKDLYQHQTIRDVIDHVYQTNSGLGVARRKRGPLPLTPMQAEFFAHRYARPNHYTQAIVVETAPLDPERLSAAFTALQREHDSLRLRFMRDSHGRVRQTLGPVRGDVLRVFDDIPGMATVAREPWLQEQLCASLDLEAGPLFQAGFSQHAAGGRLLLVAHHAIIDVLSWGILLEDLESAYARPSRGGRGRRPIQAISVAEWAFSLEARARSEEVIAQAPYWRRVLDAQRPLFEQHAEDPVGPVRQEIVVHALDAHVSAQFEDLLHARDGHNPEALLLAPLREALQAEEPVVVWIERNGRDVPEWPVSLARTVGWCTVLFPFELRVQEGAHPLERLRATERDLASIPNMGADFALLRYLAPDGSGEQMGNTLPYELVFNYLGVVGETLSGTGRLFRAPRLLKEGLMAPENITSAGVELDCYIEKGRLVCEWRVSAHLDHLARMKAVVGRYAATLERLVADVWGHEERRDTTQFALMSVDNDRLAALRSRFMDVSHE